VWLRRLTMPTRSYGRKITSPFGRTPWTPRWPAAPGRGVACSPRSWVWGEVNLRVIALLTIAVVLVLRSRPTVARRAA
jgi:hypothetical protein